APNAFRSSSIRTPAMPCSLFADGARPGGAPFFLVDLLPVHRIGSLDRRIVQHHEPRQLLFRGKDLACFGVDGNGADSSVEIGLALRIKEGVDECRCSLDIRGAFDNAEIIILHRTLLIADLRMNECDLL